MALKLIISACPLPLGSVILGCDRLLDFSSQTWTRLLEPSKTPASPRNSRLAPSCFIVSGFLNASSLFFIQSHATSHDILRLSQLASLRPSTHNLHDCFRDTRRRHHYEGPEAHAVIVRARLSAQRARVGTLLPLRDPPPPFCSHQLSRPHRGR